MSNCFRHNWFGGVMECPNCLDEWKDYPFAEFPEKGSDWEAVKQARCMAIAEFRNIIDNCKNSKALAQGTTQTIEQRCTNFAIHGLKHLGAEL